VGGGRVLSFFVVLLDSGVVRCVERERGFVDLGYVRLCFCFTGVED
jgi:hypothetical protein